MRCGLCPEAFQNYQQPSWGLKTSLDPNPVPGKLIQAGPGIRLCFRTTSDPISLKLTSSGLSISRSGI